MLTQQDVEQSKKLLLEYDTSKGANIQEVSEKLLAKEFAGFEPVKELKEANNLTVSYSEFFVVI